MPLEVDLSDFVASPTQWAFLRDRTPLRLLSGGLGSGKTRTGAEAAVDAHLENPTFDGMLVAPTFPMLNRLVLPAWLKACPPELIERPIAKDRCFLMKSGARVWYGTAEVPSSLEGTNLAWFWGDEVRYWPHESWQNMVARLRVAGARRQGFGTTTPAVGWLEDEFNRGKQGRRAFKIATIENEPNLAPGYIDDLKTSLSPRQAKSLIYGEFAVVAGQVYEEFDEARHAIPWTYDAGLPLWLSWDFGVRKASVLFAQQVGDFPYLLPDGREIPPHSVVIFDELQIDEKPTQWQIPLVQQRLAGRVPWQIVVDPAGRGRDQASGYRSVEIIEAAFGTYNRGGSRLVTYETDFEERYIPNRIARVQGALSPIEGAPTLYVAKSLVGGNRRGVVAALRGSVYPERGGRRTSDRPQEDDFEHSRDTLEYLVVAAQNASGRGGWHAPIRIRYGGR